MSFTREFSSSCRVLLKKTFANFAAADSAEQTQAVVAVNVPTFSSHMSKVGSGRPVSGSLYCCMNSAALTTSWG